MMWFAFPLVLVPVPVWITLPVVEGVPDLPTASTNRSPAVAGTKLHEHAMWNMRVIAPVYRRRPFALCSNSWLSPESAVATAISTRLVAPSDCDPLVDGVPVGAEK